MRGVYTGERPSKKRGRSVEFADYRAYTPGDDPRRLDWNILARHGKTFIKLFEDEEDATVTILLDASGSPFPILADASWSACVALSSANQDAYLADRQARGFNTAFLTIELLSLFVVDEADDQSPSCAFLSRVEHDVSHRTGNERIDVFLCNFDLGLPALVKQQCRDLVPFSSRLNDDFMIRI